MTPFHVPVIEGRVTSPFGRRTDPMDGVRGEFHKGIDFGARVGTVVLAAKDGVVEVAQENNPTAGNFMVIRHPDGTATRYLHMSKLLITKTGLKVYAKQAIGLVGSTGKSTGPHLHFEVLGKDGAPIDPGPLLGLTAPLVEGIEVRNSVFDIGTMTVGLLLIVGAALFLGRS